MYFDSSAEERAAFHLCLPDLHLSSLSAPKKRSFGANFLQPPNVSLTFSHNKPKPSFNHAVIVLGKKSFLQINLTMGGPSAGWVGNVGPLAVVFN